MMMLLLFKRNPSSFFPNFIPKTTFISHLLDVSFSSTSQDQNPPPKFNFMRDYLIASFGFSPAKAATASKHIAYVTSPEKPDSVRHFLKQNGFTDAHIQNIISNYSRILCADVHKILEPHIRALRQLGFTEDELHKLVARNPQTLILRCAISRIEFWKTYLNNDSQKLFLAFSRNRSLINLNIDENVVPKISLLKDYDLSGTQIGWLICSGCGIFVRSITSLEVLLKRVQELGFHRGSPMFVRAFASLNFISIDMFNAKMKLFKGFGWTEADFVAALHKNPAIINLSEENIREKIEFLVDKAGCTQNSISYRPKLLNFSLEKRLIPRLKVWEIINEKELIGIKPSLFCFMNYPEKTFIKRIVIPYKQAVPILHEMYVTACKGLV